MNEQKVDAVERALMLLDCFGVEDRSLSLAQLAERSGLYKSTILRLASSLERFGYLLRGEDGRYRLGPTLWRLGSAYRLGFDMAEHIRPELRRLVEVTGETASFYVREGDARVCLYRLNSPRAVRHHLEEGQRLPLNGGASAKILLAWGDGGNKAVREAGYAVSLGERDPDIAAVAVPVLSAQRQLRGALAVSGLITRFGETERVSALRSLRESAARLSKRE